MVTSMNSTYAISPVFLALLGTRQCPWLKCCLDCDAEFRFRERIREGELRSGLLVEHFLLLTLSVRPKQVGAERVKLAQFLVESERLSLDIRAGNQVLDEFSEASICEEFSNWMSWGELCCKSNMSRHKSSSTWRGRDNLLDAGNDRVKGTNEVDLIGKLQERKQSRDRLRLVIRCEIRVELDIEVLIHSPSSQVRVNFVGSDRTLTRLRWRGWLSLLSRAAGLGAILGHVQFSGGGGFLDRDLTGWNLDLGEVDPLDSHLKGVGRAVMEMQLLFLAFFEPAIESRVEV